MGGSVIFYTYGSTLELNGQQLTAGMLTADLLNLSPDEYMRLKKRMTQITDLAEEYERKRDIALWWKLNEKMDALCQKLRRYPHGFPSGPNHIPNHVDISWRSCF